MNVWLSLFMVRQYDHTVDVEMVRKKEEILADEITYLADDECIRCGCIYPVKDSRSVLTCTNPRMTEARNDDLIETSRFNWCNLIERTK